MKKIIIVGAGIAGLTAGIYCLDNGFDVEIYEKHTIAGGECTGWVRKGQYIDGCAHWIVGTNPNSDLYPLWNHIGAFDDSVVIHETEYISKFLLDDGRVFTFYSNLEKLENEMMTFFPEDKKNIKSFLKIVKAYQHIRVPAQKPLDYMSFFELISFGKGMLPALRPFMLYKHMSVEEYCSRFKNKELAGIIGRFMEPIYNIHSFFYVCQSVSKLNAGMIEGGSSKLVERIVDKYKAKGGILHLNTPVDKVLIENKKATGIILSSGEEVKADYVISACDAHFTLHNLLSDKFKDKSFEKQFSDTTANPINTAMMISFKIKKNLDDFPKMFDFMIEPIDMFGKKITHIGVRNFSFDKTLLAKDNQTLLTVLIAANETVYNNLKNMPKEEYINKKTELGNKILEMVKEHLKIKDDEIELIDVVTPLTYERYTNAYKGSYMSFKTTKFTKGLMRPGLIKGLNNFVIAGQWIMPPGGLPIALMSGKHAVMRICKAEKKEFINREEVKTSK